MAGGAGGGCEEEDDGDDEGDGNDMEGAEDNDVEVAVVVEEGFGDEAGRE